MADPRLVALIHSPALGPESWEGVAAALAPEYAAVVPSLTAAIEAGPPYWQTQCRLVHRALHAVASSTGVVLVGHSGAGPLLGLIAERLTHPVAGYVFADAGLPRRGAWLDTAPPGLVERLRSLTADGMLPPWTEWWDAEELTAEVPDPAQRARLRASTPALPVAMLEEPRPQAVDWPDAPCAYLQLSEGYADEARRAASRGWAVDVVATGHLGPVTSPGAVAAGIASLVAGLA